MEEGRDPERLLSCRYRDCRFIRDPMEGGMVPRNPYPLRLMEEIRFGEQDTPDQKHLLSPLEPQSHSPPVLAPIFVDAIKSQMNASSTGSEQSFTTDVVCSTANE
jgi:hypothetical protein